MKAFQPAMDAIECGAFQIGALHELAPELGLVVCDNIGAPGMLLLDVEWGAPTPEEEALDNWLSDYRRYHRTWRS